MEAHALSRLFAEGLLRLGRAPGVAIHERESVLGNPVGLALGAETPEEIAVSILGEVTALRRGFDAGFLNGRDTSLHRPSDTRVFARS